MEKQTGQVVCRRGDSSPSDSNEAEDDGTLEVDEDMVIVVEDRVEGGDEDCLEVEMADLAVIAWAVQQATAMRSFGLESLIGAVGPGDKRKLN